MSRVRARHVYGAAALLFVLLLGFQGIRLAAGEDPAGAATTPLRESTPAPAATATPDGGGRGGRGGGWHRRDRQGAVPGDPYGVDPTGPSQPVVPDDGQGVVPDDPYGVDPTGPARPVVPEDPGGADPGGSQTDPGGQDGGGATTPAATTDA